MIKVDMYIRGNQSQKIDVNKILNEFLPNILQHLKPNSELMDIGCGDGYVTNMMTNRINSDNLRIIGVDLSREMVSYANKNYKSDMMEFSQMDISEKLDDIWKGRFDFVSSFYCLHWVRDHGSAFRNIYNMLNNEGGCLFNFPLKHPVYNVYEILIKDPKWTDFMKDGFEKIFPYLYVFEDPVSVCTDMLKKEGFNIKCLELRKFSYKFNGISDFIAFFQAINPFIRRLPENKVKEFINDSLAAYYTLPNVQLGKDSSGKINAITLYYELMVGYITK